MSEAGVYRERRYMAQDGLSLYYRDYGDPRSPRHPVLCLGGLVRNSKDFHRFASRCAPQRRVVCPDYRGRGKSDYDPDCQNYRPEVYANDLFHRMAAANGCKPTATSTVCCIAGSRRGCRMVTRPNRQSSRSKLCQNIVVSMRGPNNSFR